METNEHPTCNRAGHLQSSPSPLRSKPCGKKQIGNWHLRCSLSQRLSIHPYITHILLRSAKTWSRLRYPSIIMLYLDIQIFQRIHYSELKDWVCGRGWSSRSPSKMKRNMWSQQPKLSSLSGKLPVQSWSPDFRSRTKVILHPLRFSQIIWYKIYRTLLQNFFGASPTKYSIIKECFGMVTHYCPRQAPRKMFLGPLDQLLHHMNVHKFTCYEFRVGQHMLCSQEAPPSRMIMWKLDKQIKIVT